MFTGIVEEIGKILSITESSITVKCTDILDNTKIGDSIAVNGVCLTVTDLKSNSFKADISPETFKVTALGSLEKNYSVNLERAMPINGRFGGHIVSGHIDNIGKIKSIRPNNQFYNVEIELTKEESKYLIRKGSIAINGISLTIADVNENLISIAVIPHTFESTNLKTLNSGDFVNIEIDILAKYVEKFLSTIDNKSRININFLQENGFC